MPDFSNDSVGDYSDQFFGMPPMDDEQRKRLLRTPPFLSAPGPINTPEFSEAATARQATDAAPAGAQTADLNEVRQPTGAQTADMNEVNLPEKSARTATPPTYTFGESDILMPGDKNPRTGLPIAMSSGSAMARTATPTTGSAMDSPAFNALVTPRTATPADRYNEWESRRPDQPPVLNPGLKRRALEGLTTAGAALVNPLLGRVVNNLWEGPQYAAQKRYGQARQAWEDEGKGIIAGAQLAREDTNTQTEADLRRAQAEEANARAYELRHPQTKQGLTPEETTIHDLMTGEKGGPRLNPETGKPYSYLEAYQAVKQAAQDVRPDKTPTELQEDQRFEQIDTARRMGKPVSPEDKAWADAYKNRKTLGQQVINVGADLRGKSFGRNRPMQVLDTWNGNRPVVVSAGEAEDNPARYVTQSGGEKSLPKEALINDIRVSAENVKKNLAVLDSSGFDRVKLAAALADPNSTAQSYLQAIPRGSLDENSQQFVADLFNLREQAMAMRSVLGAGQGSEDMRRAILSTLPGVASPSQKFGAKQIDNLIGVLNRVERGVPQVPLAPERGGQGGGAPAPPQVGAVVKGYRFKGGDPSQQSSWEKAK